MDEIVAEIWNDHTYDFSTGGKQQSIGWITDQLTCDKQWMFSHISNGANYHRSRVNMLTDAFLCESFSRDIPLTGEIDFQMMKQLQKWYLIRQNVLPVTKAWIHLQTFLGIPSKNYEC